MSTSKQMCKDIWTSQEPWLVSIRGIQIRLVTASFRRHYMASVNSSNMAPTTGLSFSDLSPGT